MAKKHRRARRDVRADSREAVRRAAARAARARRREGGMLVLREYRALGFGADWWCSGEDQAVAVTVVAGLLRRRAVDGWIRDRVAGGRAYRVREAAGRLRAVRRG